MRRRYHRSRQRSRRRRVAQCAADGPDGRTHGRTGDGLWRLTDCDGMCGAGRSPLLRLLTLCCLVRAGCAGNPDAKRLYDDLLSNYNKLVRPVVNVTDPLKVKIKLKLSQLIDVVSALKG